MDYLFDDSIDSDAAETLGDPLLRELYRYWSARRGAQRWPARDSIDPLDLKPLLGRMVLLETVGDHDGPLHFRYRLFGTSFVDWFGFDMTGRMIDDWPEPEYRTVMNASYREVVAAGRPFRRLRRFVKDGRLLRYEALMLPLGNATQVTMVLVAQVFID